MKKARSKFLCAIAILLGAFFVLACVAGFAACDIFGGESSSSGSGSGEGCGDGNHTVSRWTWEDDVEANCGVSGTRTGICIVCGKVVTEYVEASGNHTSDEGVVTTEATCGAAGETTYTCTVCGQIIDTQVIEATGDHDWVAKKTVSATCTAAGAVDYECSVCGDTYTETASALGHDYEGNWTWKAESSGGGYTVTATLDSLVCSRCGEESVENVSDEAVTLNDDGTYTAAVTASDGESYEDTNRVFAESDDGVKTDAGTGATYTPVGDDDEPTSYELTSVPGGTTNLSVAGYIDGLSVSVAERASSSSANLTTLVFEEGVTGIGKYAFSNCDKLESVEFCSTLTDIGMYAFTDCDALLGVEIPNSVSSIGSYAFNGSESLESVVIHGLKRGTTDIGSYSFVDCTALETVAFEGGTVSVGMNSFKGCTSLECVKFYSGLLRAGTGQAINSYAFSGDTSLSTLIISGSVSIPNNINGVSETAFQNCPIADVYFDGNREGWETTKNIFNMNVKSGDPNISDECAVHYSSDEPVYGCWHWSGDEIVMWTEREEADARITGSADFNEHDISTNFTIEEGLAFDGSSVTASFVETKADGTMVYELSGTSCAMGEELAAAFYNEDEAAEHAECEYVAFMVNLYEDETATITTYNGDVQEKIWTDMNWHSDTAFVLDLANHNEGDWSMVIDITRMDGSSVTYRLTLGTIVAA